jgi:AraC-like DNA-binding protein
MAPNAVRDLYDWITGFGSLQERMRARLAKPAPDPRLAGGRPSGARLGWRDLGFEQVEFAAGAALPAGKPDRHVVLLGLGSGRVAATQSGVSRAYEIRPGSVLLIPAAADGAWKAETALQCCLLFLDARVLARAAAASYQARPQDFEMTTAHVDYDFGVIGLAGVLTEEAMRGVRGNNLYVNSLAAHLAVHLLRHYAQWKRKEPAAERRTAFERALNAPEAVQRAVVHIRENHTRDIGAQEIADAAGENAFVLRRLFYETLGTEPGQYLLQLRMQSAESLIAAGAKSLPEVARAVGFGSLEALPSWRDEGRGTRNEGQSPKQGAGA